MKPDFVPGAPLRFLERHEVERVCADEVLHLDGVGLVVAAQHQPHVPCLAALRGAIEIELRRVIQRQAVVLGVLKRLRLLLHLHDARRVEMRLLQVEHRL